jgi:two-component system LytT family response regulator
MLKVLIIDEARESRELTQELLASHCEGIAVIGTVANIQLGIEAIYAQKPDVVLLEAQLRFEPGFNVLERMQPEGFELVFITACAPYIQSDLNSLTIDCLLKPVQPDKLKQIMEKARARRSQAASEGKRVALLPTQRGFNSATYQKIALPTTDGLLFVPVEDIIYCEAEGAYTMIHLKSAGKMLVSKNLKEYEQQLSGHYFLRVHHSYLINLNEVKKYVRGEGGYVVMSNNTSVDVAKRRKEIFLAAVAAYAF